MINNSTTALTYDTGMQLTDTDLDGVSGGFWSELATVVALVEAAVKYVPAAVEWVGEQNGKLLDKGYPTNGNLEGS